MQRRVMNRHTARAGRATRFAFQAMFAVVVASSIATAACSNEEKVLDELVSAAEKELEQKPAVRIELPEKKALIEAEEKECDTGYDCFIEARRAMLDEEKDRSMTLYKKACEMESIEACRRLGKILQDGKHGVEEDPDEAERYLALAVKITRAGCDAGEGARCTELGKLHTTGDGVLRDRNVMMAFFDKACGHGDVQGCRLLGAARLEQGQPGRDPAQAARAFLRACELEEDKRCSDLGRMLSDRIEGTRDIALPFVSRGCEEQDLEFACAVMAEFYERGLGVEQDPDRAKSLEEKACNPEKITACATIASMYQSGTLVPQDAIESLRLFQVACESGDRDACKEAEAFLKKVGLEGEEERRDEIEATCKRGDLAACHKLGQALLPGRGRMPDQRRAVKFFEDACREGYVPSCVSLAELYELGAGTLRDYPSAVRAYEKACERGSGEGCHRLSRMSMLGIHIERDDERAVVLSIKACDLGDFRSCTESGIAYMFGNGVERDFDRAIDLLDRACDGGHPRGCSQLEIAREYAPEGVRAEE